jgi:gamma-glutamyl:cysteine ligase YbdK (ATP-grasp superfamily)
VRNQTCQKEAVEADWLLKPNEWRAVRAGHDSQDEADV